MFVMLIAICFNLADRVLNPGSVCHRVGYIQHSENCPQRNDIQGSCTRFEEYHTREVSVFEY